MQLETLKPQFMSPPTRLCIENLYILYEISDIQQISLTRDVEITLYLHSRIKINSNSELTLMVQYDNTKKLHRHEL